MSMDVYDPREDMADGRVLTDAQGRPVLSYTTAGCSDPLDYRLHLLPGAGNGAYAHQMLAAAQQLSYKPVSGDDLLGPDSRIPCIDGYEERQEWDDLYLYMSAPGEGNNLRGRYVVHIAPEWAKNTPQYDKRVERDYFGPGDGDYHQSMEYMASMWYDPGDGNAIDICDTMPVRASDPWHAFDVLMYQLYDASREGFDFCPDNGRMPVYGAVSRLSEVCTAVRARTRDHLSRFDDPLVSDVAHLLVPQVQDALPGDDDHRFGEFGGPAACVVCDRAPDMRDGGNRMDGAWHVPFLLRENAPDRGPVGIHYGALTMRSAMGRVKGDGEFTIVRGGHALNVRRAPFPDDYGTYAYSAEICDVGGAGVSSGCYEFTGETALDAAVHGREPLACAGSVTVYGHSPEHAAEEALDRLCANMAKAHGDPQAMAALRDIGPLVQACRVDRRDFVRGLDSMFKFGVLDKAGSFQFDAVRQCADRSADRQRELGALLDASRQEPSQPVAERRQVRLPYWDPQDGVLSSSGMEF